MVYSNNSPACQKLFAYIESLPFDLMNVTGITPCCADNKTMRNTLEKVGVEAVPTLMTKYFNNYQQQLQGDEVYNWISKIANIMGYAENGQTSSKQEEQLESVDEPEEENEESQPKPRVGGSLLTQALSMQKSRENEMSTKKIHPQK